MTDEKILDYSFHFPPGVKEVRYKTPDDFEVWQDDYAEEIEEETVEFSGSDIEYEMEADENIQYPPDYMNIVSQVVRTLPGGGQVVDVTLELPDLEDGSKYDIRVTK